MKMTIGRKLVLAFLGISFLVFLAGLFGVLSVNKVGNSTDAISYEQVPVADCAMEMKAAVIAGRDSMGEYLLTENPEELSSIKQNFESYQKDEDKFSAAILKGDDSMGVKPAKDSDVRKLVEEADTYHGNFVKSSEEMMKNHDLTLKYAQEKLDYMDEFDNKRDEVMGNLVELEKTEESNTSATDAAMEMKVAVLNQGDGYAEYLLKQDTAGLDKIKENIEKWIKEYDRFEGVLDVQQLTAAGKKLKEETVSDHTALHDVGEKLLLSHKNYLEAKENAHKHMGELDDWSEKTRVAMVKAEELVSKDMEDAMSSADRAQTTAGVTLTIVSIAGFLLAVILGLIISRAITKPIVALTGAAETISKGDLTAEIKVTTKDEIGQLADAFRNTVSSLNTIITQVLNASERVSASSQQLSSAAEEMNATTEEVSSTVQQIAKGTETQAQRVDETQKVMEEMSSSVMQVSKSAQDAAGQATTSAGNAQKGGDLTKNAQQKIIQIAETVINSAGAVRKLGDRSEQISEIVKVITGIADQTNLLALNAAIEAARAGEYGRGFAVVAEEVRKLAESSAKAADEIGKLIKDVQKETLQAVSDIEGASKEAGTVRDITQQIVVSLNEIIKNTESVASMIEQVSASSQQQAAGTKQVSKSISDIASVAEETASATEEASASTEEMTASMEEMAASAQELADMGISLRDMVAKFKVSSETRDVGRGTPDVGRRTKIEEEKTGRLAKLKEHADAMKKRMEDLRKKKG